MVDFAKLLAQTKAAQSQNISTQQPQPQPSTVTSAPMKQEAVTAAPAPAATAALPDLGMETAAAEVVGKVDESKGAEIEYPGLAELQQRIYALNDALQKNHPAMDSLLQTIHRNLQKDPELVHMLRPEDTATIFAGLQKKTQTKIVEETVKSAKSGKNRGLKNIGLEDL